MKKVFNTILMLAIMSFVVSAGQHMVGSSCGNHGEKMQRKNNVGNQSCEQTHDKKQKKIMKKDHACNDCDGKCEGQKKKYNKKHECKDNCSMKKKEKCVNCDKKGKYECRNGHKQNKCTGKCGHMKKEKFSMKKSVKCGSCDEKARRAKDIKCDMKNDHKSKYGMKKPHKFDGCDSKEKCNDKYRHRKMKKYSDRKEWDKHDDSKDCYKHSEEKMKKNYDKFSRKFKKKYHDKENYMRQKYKSKKLNAYFQKIMKDDENKSYEMLMNEVMDMTGKIIKGNYCASDRLVLRKGIKLKVYHLRKMF